MIATKLQAVRTRIADAARRAGRPPESVRLICVTKSATISQIREAVAAGAADLGENRLQDALPKIEAIGRSVTWHMIGHLQRNKVKLAVAQFGWVHSVDTVALALMLERQAAEAGRTVPVLIEVVLGTCPPDVTRAVAGCGDQWSEEVITQAAAARALGMIGDDAAVPALVAALEPTFTRAEAAAALAKFGSGIQ